HVGPPQVAHAAGAGQPRLQRAERRGLLPVLRQRRGRPVEGLLQLRRGRLAHRRAEQREGRGRHVPGLGAGAVAARGPRGHEQGVRARVLAPPALLQPRELDEELFRHAVLASVVRSGRRDGRQRPLPPVRALRAAGPGRRARPGERHPAVHGGHRRALAVHAAARRAEHRGAEQRHVRRAQADAEAGRLRLGVRPGGGRLVHRFRTGHVPLIAEPRAAFGPPVPLLDLGRALREQRIACCQWKGHDKPERWATGRGDIDLLVDRADAARFHALAARFGFREAVPPPARTIPGLADYVGPDPATGVLLRLHVHYRLVVGRYYTARYRLPLEQPVL